MKKFFAVLAITGGIAMADTVVTPPQNMISSTYRQSFIANTPTGNTPYWNNRHDGSHGEYKRRRLCDQFRWIFGRHFIADRLAVSRRNRKSK